MKAVADISQWFLSNEACFHELPVEWLWECELTDFECFSPSRTTKVEKQNKTRNLFHNLQLIETKGIFIKLKSDREPL